MILAQVRRGMLLEEKPAKDAQGRTKLACPADCAGSGEDRGGEESDEGFNTPYEMGGGSLRAVRQARMYLVLGSSFKARRRKKKQTPKDSKRR